MQTLKNKEQKMPKFGFKVNFEPWKSPEINKGIPIANHGFVQDSFIRNLGYRLPKASLFWPDCFKTLYVMRHPKNPWLAIIEK